MEKFVINPKGYREEYISNLNACFGHWGGDAEYKWGLERQIGKHTTDIMLIENEEDGVIAGSAVSYRKLSRGNTSFDIGIMTGSWTLPAARRKGCFTKMINCSKELCKDNQVPFLTAFVTETNASSRRLESEGSYMFPTSHLFSPEKVYNEKDIPAPEVVVRNQDVDRQIFSRAMETQKELLSFSYSFEEFRSQYLDRIKQTTILKIEDDYAILENGQNEIKILLLTFLNNNDFLVYQKAIGNWCLKNRGRKSFFFTTRNELASICEEIGFNNVSGYFTILESMGDATEYNKKFADLHINMGDKM
ncbi:GNAT family N-acetyltransferase [Salinimicrobium terrae]|uniref:GNAT family N-acetyltransferase n=1 Tax=Salinimicrobium terrae TaxID=470866 RepID=UPI00040BA4DF|nr:N-acetyltransferase [Salinimicrobium terrae]